MENHPCCDRIGSVMRVSLGAKMVSIAIVEVKVKAIDVIYTSVGFGC